jgi:hypothetical protein
MQTKTPETDQQLQIQAEDSFYSGIADINSTNGVPAEFARQLELQRDEAREQLKNLQELSVDQYIRLPNVAEYIRQLKQQYSK